MNYEENNVTLNTDNHHFEMIVDGEIAFIDYRRKNNTIYLIHTEVPAHLRGRGIGTAIITKTFDYLAKNKLKFIPYCATIKSFIEKNRKWDHLKAY